MNTDRRLTPTERLHEVTLAAINRAPSQPESAVTLTRNAKGDVQIEVTVRNAEPDVAADTCLSIFHGLCLAYPRADATSASDELEERLRATLERNREIVPQSLKAHPQNRTQAPAKPRRVK